MKKNSLGFTLIELLVVLLIISLVFSIIIVFVKELGIGGIYIKEEAENLKNEAYLSLRLKQQLEGIYGHLALQEKKDGLYLAFITTSGEGFNGVVKARYRYFQGNLFYCETIYTKDSNIKELIFCPQEKEFLLTKIRNFSVKVYYHNKWIVKKFFGVPEKVKIKLNNYKLIARTRMGGFLP